MSRILELSQAFNTEQEDLLAILSKSEIDRFTMDSEVMPALERIANIVNNWLLCITPKVIKANPIEVMMVHDKFNELTSCTANKHPSLEEVNSAFREVALNRTLNERLPSDKNMNRGTALATYRSLSDLVYNLRKVNYAPDG